jgi:hypothetical protein
VGSFAFSGGSSVSYRLVPGMGAEGNSFFEIDGTNLKTRVVLGHEGTNSLSVRVKALSAASVNLVYAETFEIRVVDVAEPPTGIVIDDAYVLEEQPAGTAVGRLVAIDNDTNDVHTFAFAAGAGDSGNGLFAIDGDVLKTAAVLDYESSPTHSVRVRVEDSAGLALEAPLTVYVHNIIEPAGEPDIDADGMPDWWEYNYSGTDTALGAGVDLDGDGAVNLSEWQDDTNPLDGTSFAPQAAPRGTMFTFR